MRRFERKTVSQSGRARRTSLCPAGAGVLSFCALMLFVPTAGWSASDFAPISISNALPFATGEELGYRASVSRLGTVGRATMAVEGPAQLRGRSVLVLRFDFRSRVGPVLVEDRTRSWLDPVRMASLRFTKHERHVLFTNNTEVDFFPAERRWQAADGTSGTLPTDAPLDELSFIYHVRALPLNDGDAYSCVRHFDEVRNPVSVRVISRGRLTVPAGTFSTILVEMRVKDPARYGGEGVIRLHLTDDAARVPVRIETSVPRVGATVLDLESGFRAGVQARS